jgi:hypothetical protein
MTSNKSIMIFLILFIILAFPAHVVFAQDATDDEIYSTPEKVVDDLYEFVTFPPGTSPDWEKVKSLFIDEAVIVLRTSFTKMEVMGKDGFVDLFTRDIQKHNMKETGFQEKIVRKKMTVIGDVAHCFVLYEASVPNSPGPPQQGVDSFQLLKKDGRWWIVSIINEIPRPGVSIPGELLVTGMENKKNE